MDTDRSEQNAAGSNENTPREVVDLCGKTCPETFVEAKLALEELDDGERLKVILDDPRSAERVPDNMENHGQIHVRTNHQNGIWTLVFERKQERDRERWVMLD